MEITALVGKKQAWYRSGDHCIVENRHDSSGDHVCLRAQFVLDDFSGVWWFKWSVNLHQLPDIAGGPSVLKSNRKPAS